MDGVLLAPSLSMRSLGMIFTRSGKVNVDRYGWNGSWRYAIQRMTGYLAVAFIFLHITLTAIRLDVSRIDAKVRYPSRCQFSCDPFPTG